jgi:hypothetical protein
MTNILKTFSLKLFKKTEFENILSAHLLVGDFFDDKMKKREKGKTRRTFWSAAGAIVASLTLGLLTAKAGETVEIKEIVESEETEVQIRDKIIELIEDELSEAYSFTGSSTHRVPHFEVLDRIFPKWHHGDPAAARQFWVNAGYQTFMVFYRVDYVYVVNEVSAKVEGKRLVLWKQTADGPDYSEFWPFQLWAALPKRTHRDNTYLSAIYPMRFKMKLTVNERGEWYIAEERIRDKPEMSNNLQNHCLYEKHLEEWGLKNDCNKKLLPQ